MNQILSLLRDIIWGTPTLAVLITFGIYFTRKSSFFRPGAVKKTLSDTFGSLSLKPKDGISPFSALATALGGTVGIGSIVGVGVGIAVGGAGSIFWLWVCSFFGMGLKYAEVYIALNRRENRGNVLLGGAPFRLRGMGHNNLAVLFCVLCIAVSFGTGNLTQVGSIASFLGSAGVSKTACGIICAVCTGIAVFGGRKRIAGINTVLVPLASVVYIAVCAVILILNSSGIIPAFKAIFSEAFGFSAVSGGFSGALVAHTVREGFSKSLFSNEAGMGSSPLAHATARVDDPRVQAEWGIFEIFFDTFVVSTLTALCLLSSGVTDPALMLSDAFGVAGKLLFGLLAAVFAFASVISWCYYAECCIAFLFPKSAFASAVYRVMFSLSAFLGVYISFESIWEISDILNALMLIPNLFLLFKCRNEIERIAD